MELGWEIIIFDKLISYQIVIFSLLLASATAAGIFAAVESFNELYGHDLALYGSSVKYSSRCHLVRISRCPLQSHYLQLGMANFDDVLMLR